jgi:hypothetical protein
VLRNLKRLERLEKSNLEEDKVDLSYLLEIPWEIARKMGVVFPEEEQENENSD